MNTKLQHDIGVPVRETDTAEALREAEPAAAVRAPVANSESFAILRHGVRALKRSWNGQRAFWERMGAWRRATAIARETSRQQQQPLTSQD